MQQMQQIQAHQNQMKQIQASPGNQHQFGGMGIKHNSLAQIQMPMTQ